MVPLEFGILKRAKILLCSKDINIFTILFGSSDFIVCLWYIRTSKIINIFTGHKATSYDIEYSPFVNIVCSASYDHTIRFWSTKMNNQDHCINTSKNKDNGIKCIKFIKSKNNDFIDKTTCIGKITNIVKITCIDNTTVIDKKTVIYKKTVIDIRRKKHKLGEVCITPFFFYIGF
ncbi:hypothetical protein RFI_34410 [Reticulomyxa filosa]|uniref:Uncharacterized protein n=1 Tax=Reticulomyxa filosa TaxID=46433 RepID=X6LNQ9_RETFI|nr:hypothetical protein RFI_34410 [Reticulomyxa filosa]|eukprot:ETO03001.1 hypothetical protein RFI_34410 [Reticulomyxa filosa]